jgi:polyferredoxin
MKFQREHFLKLATVLSFGLIPALFCQFFTREPVNRSIHITSFRYGKEPCVIRCNRGDTLHLTFSTKDTGHSFFLEEFDRDVKVSPGRKEVEVFKPSNPSEEPLVANEITLIARHPGIHNYITAKSNYRCHVWCGPMHAFEQGKLIILPNTLLVFSLGILVGIVLLWVMSIFRNSNQDIKNEDEKSGYKEILKTSGFLRKVVTSRYTQAALTLLAMVMIYIVILTSVFGTKMSGRNLGVLLMWAIWLFVLVALFTPFLGRFWCTICPLPFFGDLIQRRSFFNPQKGQAKKYNNKFYGFFLKWPARLDYNWMKLIIFLVLATFSTTLVAVPRVSGITVLTLLLIPTLMSVVWELRAFCRYICPVSAFSGPYSKMSFLALRNKSQAVCDNCKPHYCEKGNANGWACPYGINVGRIQDNFDCGLCLECIRSCTYNNVSLYLRPFGIEHRTRNLSEAWLAIAGFTIAIIYSILYLGPWPVVRDFVNIIDKHNWSLFGIYSLIMWASVLIITPGIIYLLSIVGVRMSKADISKREVFLRYAGALLPLGLFLWIAFVIPMLFVNVTFIIQSISDPFGWGWDFFNTANIPWHQFIPQYIPWLQALFVLTGLHISLRNIRKMWVNFQMDPLQAFSLSLPVSLFITAIAVTMLFFFTN